MPDQHHPKIIDLPPTSLFKCLQQVSELHRAAPHQSHRGSQIKYPPELNIHIPCTFVLEGGDPRCRVETRRVLACPDS